MNSNAIIDHRNTQRCHDPNVHSCFCPLAQTSSTDQISGYHSIPLPCLLCQALNVLLFSPKVKLDGVHASIPFIGVTELCSSGTSASADTIRCTVFCWKPEHQMSKSSYLYWTQSFFGHSGFAPVETGKTVAKRGEEATEGEKTRTRKDLKVPKWGETFFSPLSLTPRRRQQIVTFDILSFLSIDLFCSQRLRTSHSSLILEMILYQEHLLRGTKEKCFCALVYDKQVYILPSPTHQLWRYSDWGGWRRRQKSDYS